MRIMKFPKTQRFQLRHLRMAYGEGVRYVYPSSIELDRD